LRKPAIFEYKSYKSYLLDWIALTPANGRGQRKLLAQAIGCQTPFITQVLNGDYHFSPEQAEACSRWLGLSIPEGEFFLLLVMKERAGTKSLELMIERQLAERRESETQLKKRLGISDSLSNEDHIQYYSSWHYPAIHMALLNPALRTLEALHAYFALPLPRLLAVLDFLLEKKLIRAKSGQYEVMKPVIHLDKDSPLLPKHHTNWRLRAIEAVESRAAGNFHYSGVISVSADDFEWIKGKLAQALEASIDRLRNSPDERVGCLNIDLFSL
jgi:uncharacterized protein (TIGR02147 family)